MKDGVTISLFELASRYPTDDAARMFLEEQRWHGQPVCPYCGTLVHQHKHHHKGEQGYYHCSTCNQVYTVRNGTIFERSHIGLAKWRFALYYILTARKGVSSLQLSKHLGITQKSTWFMLQRIRTAMSAGSIKLSGTVEIDEAYIRNVVVNIKQFNGKYLSITTNVRMYNLHSIYGTLKPIICQQGNIYDILPDINLNGNWYLHEIDKAKIIKILDDVNRNKFFQLEEMDFFKGCMKHFHWTSSRTILRNYIMLWISFQNC
jgi:transposase-like protein